MRLAMSADSLGTETKGRESLFGILAALQLEIQRSLGLAKQPTPPCGP
jgi:hypothetical protein